MSLMTEGVHLVLVQTLLAAKLELSLPVLKIDVLFCVADVATPVAHFTPFEVGPATGGKAFLATESFGFGGSVERVTFKAKMLTPCANNLKFRCCIFCKARKKYKTNYKI